MTEQHRDKAAITERFILQADHAKTKAEWAALDGSDDELAKAIDERLHIEEAATRSGVFVDAFTTDPDGIYLPDRGDVDTFQLFAEERAKLKPDASGQFSAGTLELLERERTALKQRVLDALHGNTDGMNDKEIELYLKMAASQLEAAWSPEV